MTVINRSALLPYRAEQLYALVTDIESYPRFMDGCVGAEVLHREDNLMEARLDLARAGIRQSFSTRNRCFDGQVMTLELIEGPFDFFQGRWEFMALGEAACKVSLNLEFNVNSSVLGAAASSLFDRVTNNLVDALGQRAKEVYG